MNFNPWHILGGLAQLVFASRFVVQWWTSERLRRSVMPRYFWYASLIGALGLLAYAIHLRDPVFISAQAFGLVVYSRNLMLRGSAGA